MPANRRRFLLPALLLVGAPFLFSGCVSSSLEGGSSATQPITRTEILTAGAPDAYSLLVRNRPSWLRTSGGTLVLYVDNARVAQGGAVRDALERFAAGRIREVHWIPEEEAREMPMAPPGRIRGAIHILTGS